jgi:hypothetical protein
MPFDQIGTVAYAITQIIMLGVPQRTQKALVLRNANEVSGKDELGVPKKIPVCYF